MTEYSIVVTDHGMPIHVTDWCRTEVVAKGLANKWWREHQTHFPCAMVKLHLRTLTTETLP